MDKDGRPPPPNSIRGQLISPPNSGGSVGAMSNGFPPPGNVGGPSPPPSVGRSSAGTNAQVEPDMPTILREHYVTFNRFLLECWNKGSRKPYTPAGETIDKVRRLTPVQFLELSTDVLDELMRRLAVAPPAPSPLGCVP